MLRTLSHNILWTATRTSASPLLHNSNCITTWRCCRNNQILQQHQQLNRVITQRRSYIFFPASLSESAQFLKELLGSHDSHKQYRKHLTVKLQTRWQDALFNFRHRLKLLKTAQEKQRKLARQHAQAASLAAAKRYSSGAKRYSSFVNKMQGKMGSLSSSTAVISRGKKNILSLYNAKKRVYARRKLARKQLLAINAATTTSSNDADTVSTRSHNSIVAGGNTTWKGITLTEPTQNEWFDKEGYPKTSRDPLTGRFVNPWSPEKSNGENGLMKFLKWKFSGLFRLLDAAGIVDGNAYEKETSTGTNKTRSATATITYQAAHFRQAENSIHRTTTDVSESNQHSHPSERIDLTWIGHSTTLINFPGNFTILTDPHFSNYAGPVKRNTPPSFSVDDLPNVVDCVMISHDHMDHLDYFSICELIDKNKVKFWVVPLGIKSWLMDKAGVPAEDIIELEWWEGVRLSKSTSSSVPEIEGLVRPFDKSSGERSKDELHASMPEKNSLVVTCAPAQHWCSRTPFDRNRRLWCSYAAHATPASSQSTGFAPLTHSFYFAGDTGLPPEFPLHHMIGDRLGPFDLAAIPIGAYEPNWFMRESHCNPAEAVKIHQAVRSKRSVAVHFDTFDLADEPREEPPTLLLEEVDRVNQDILNMAVEVVAVADEVGITAKLEAVENDLVVPDITLPTNNDQVSAEKFVKLLPPLVDFAVIKQGQSISSTATKTD